MVLLDVRMPACSGIELLRRQVPGLPPAILLTTFDDDEALFDGMRVERAGLSAEGYFAGAAGRCDPPRAHAMAPCSVRC
ncbi:hypothetical protein LP420_24155 [Massilia sp. B-10]|nr:hypothetical protein LP420_24155 [Massilia sp. B-10]